ncbi:acetylcholine receptor subunit alpha-type acr-16-like isoform X1 [Planococcus citri]|uniref:acetylcholine receptor subunit alpha-type acr-16-like isoform X1 n=1 Tax=Planococcus citri TaxID=170843 RepID=UPI0031FA2E35
MSMKFYVIFLILSSVTYTNGRIRDCESKPGGYETKLKCYLFSNFDLLSPPPHAQSSSSTIADMVMTYVDLNIEDGVLIFIGSIFMQWNDERTVWDSKKFGDVLDLEDIKADLLWRPSLTLNNNLFVDSRYNNSFGAGHLQIGSDGILHWTSSMNLQTRCAISSNSWPWDPQKCILNFTIDTPDIYVTFSELVHNLPGVPSLWSIAGVKKEMGFPHVIFELTLKMESRTLQIASCLTLIAVSLVLLPSFLISPVSRIKLASKVLSLLMLVISLVILMNLIPNFTAIAPNFLIAFGTIFSMVGISSCITAFLLRLARKSHTYHPSLITEVGNSKENKRENAAMKMASFEDSTPFDDKCSIEESLSQKSENEWLRTALVIETYHRYVQYKYRRHTIASAYRSEGMYFSKGRR